MAGLNELMGPSQVLGPRERQALIEAGVMTREDFMDKTAPVVPRQPTYDARPSTAQEDLAKSLGLTVPQLIARQNAQKEEFLRKRKAAGYANGGMVNINPSKPLDMTVTPYDVNVGKIIDEWRREQADQAYNESRQRMFDARSRQDAAAAVQPPLRPSERLLRSLSSPWYQAPPDMTEDTRAPAFSSTSEAIKTGMDPRLGVSQLAASPLLITDVAETALDAVRGVKSPSRFRQASNVLSSLLGGPEDVDRTPGAYDKTYLASTLLNPGNFLPLGKLRAAAMAPRGLQRLLGGHSLEAVTAPLAALRDITHADDFYEQAKLLSAAQDKRGGHLLSKGGSIPDMLSDMLDKRDNGGRVFEVLPTETNKRGWAMIGPKGESTYISGIMSEEPGSKDFTTATINALLKEIGGKATATAANEDLAKMYRAKGIPVKKDWSMNFAKGGMIDFDELHGY